jgi:hypothetical protein
MKLNPRFEGRQRQLDVIRALINKQAGNIFFDMEKRDG